MPGEPPVIDVDYPVALADRAIEITLRDLPPRQPVSLTATQVFPSGSRWRAQATFISDEQGRVDIARQAPSDGSYEGIEPMGLIWSADRVPGQSFPPPTDFIMTPRLVQLEAISSDGVRAETTLERQVAGPGVTRLAIRENGIVGTLFLPTGVGPHPAVIVFNGGGGGLNEYWAATLASHGFAALALGVFNVEGRPRGLVNIPLEYFETAIHWMRRQPWLRDHFLAVWGPSRGGELALLLGATFPEIDAVVAWVPSGVLFWALGPSEPDDLRPRAAWTFRGKPLPCLQDNNAQASTIPVETEPGAPVAWSPAYLAHLDDKAAVEQATIPVEKTQGPILLVSGSDDQMWPSARLADIAIRRLKKHRHRFRFEHFEYEGAGHTILVPYCPLTVRSVGLAVKGLDGLFSQGGTPSADAAAGVDAWGRTLAFLRDGVQGRS